MILEPFDYLSPRLLDEALKEAEKRGEDFKFLAGGQSLIPMMKLGLTRVSCIIDLKKIRELSFVESSQRELRVGALVKHVELERSPLVKSSIPILSRAAGAIAHPLVRNRGTIGGSISLGHPSADLPVISLLLDAKIEVVSFRGNRWVRARDFFRGPMVTDLKTTEIVRSVSFTIPRGKYGWSFRKLVMSHGDFPLLIVATMLEVEGGIIKEARIALGGVGETPLREINVEEFLKDREASEEVISKAARIASSDYTPPPSPELSSGYLKRMIEVYVRRCLKESSWRGE